MDGSGDIPVPFLAERPVYRAIDLFPAPTRALEPTFMTLAASDIAITRSSSLEQEPTRGTGPVDTMTHQTHAQTQTHAPLSFGTQEFWTGAPTHATAHKLLGTGSVNLATAPTAKSLHTSIAQLAITTTTQTQTHTQDMIIPDVPPYIEQFTSFYTTREPKAVLFAICRVFSDNNRVDYEMSTRKPKVCVCFLWVFLCCCLFVCFLF